MATFGCKHPCFKPNGTGTTGVVIGKLVSANNTVTLASGELYADDELTEEVSEFSKGSIAMETDDMTDAVASVVYGATVANSVVSYNIGDSAPTGVLGYYKAIMRNGVKLYKGYFYPNAKASLGNDNAQTKGSNITFQTTQTTFTVKQDSNGDWRKTKEFSDEASAKAWVESQCGVSTAYKVSVSVQGASGSEGVDKSGDYYVASGSSFTLNITGYSGVTAAYDNGVDKKTAITGGGGTYTVSNVTADHTIAIIF